MARLFELTSEGKIVPGIVNRNYTLVLGNDFINDPAPILQFSQDFPRGRIFEADFENMCFYPEQYQEARVMVFIRDQIGGKAIGAWDVFHEDDPICEEPHIKQIACYKCQTYGVTERDKCGHVCNTCRGKYKVAPRRIHIHDLEVVAKHYSKKYIRRSNVRGGMELLVYMYPGDVFQIIKYTRTWWRNLNRRFEFDLDGRLRVTTFSDQDIEQPETTWL